MVIEKLQEAHKELQGASIKRELVIGLFNEYAGDPEGSDVGWFADEVARIIKGKVNECHYCGHRGYDVNRYAHYHVGGKDNCFDFCCDDYIACINREKEEN